MARSFIKQLLNFFYPVCKKWLPFEVYAYLAVGAANTVFNIGLFTVFFVLLNTASEVSFWGVAIGFPVVEIATAISFVLSVLSGFWLSKNFAFTDAENNKTENNKQFRRYFFVSLQGQFSDYLITKALIVFLLFNPVTAYFISTFIMLCINYFLQKYYTFRSGKAAALK